MLNAADEVVVQAFLDGRIRFPDIFRCLARVLDRRPQEPADDLETLFEADRWAREEAMRVAESVR